MKTTFYDQVALKGNSHRFSNGSYTFNQFSHFINHILSVSIGAHTMITLYNANNFNGIKYVISNPSRKQLKIGGFEKNFPYEILSFKIESARQTGIIPTSMPIPMSMAPLSMPGIIPMCSSIATAMPMSMSMSPSMCAPIQMPIPNTAAMFKIIKEFFTVNNHKLVGYTYYKVLPDPPIPQSGPYGFGIPGLDIPRADVIRYVTGGVDIPGFGLDLARVDLSKLDLSKADLDRFDLSRFNITNFDVARFGQPGCCDHPAPNPVVFIIPDFGTERSLYSGIQDYLANIRVSSIILDIRGVGQSYASHHMSYADIISDYTIITKKLFLYHKKPILIGHGTGGAIAQMWALANDFMFSRLILINSAPFATFHALNAAYPAISNWISSSINKKQLADYIAALAFFPQDESLINDLSQSIQTAHTNSLKLFITQNPDNPDLLPTISTIRPRVLIIHGIHDEYIPIVASEHLYSLLHHHGHHGNHSHHGNHTSFIRMRAKHAPHLENLRKTMHFIMQFINPYGERFFDPAC